MSGKVTINTVPVGGAGNALAQLEQCRLENFTDKTLRFIRRAMENPEYRARIQKRAEEIRAQGLYT
ncbi:MAG: hypothetical protein IJ960_00755 [Oscillospiraceae bacterium]|nr:hypothetical protein [Oscillospiraceae bacterium]